MRSLALALALAAGLAGIARPAAGASPDPAAATPDPAAAAPAPSPALPPADCVRRLRAARIAALRGDAAGELEILRAALEVFPDEVSTLYALIDYGGRHPLPAEEQAAVLARLRERVADPSRPLAAGVVHRIAGDPAADGDALRLLAGAVARRLEGTGDDQAARWLAVLSELQSRLGELEAAAATLERLRRLTPTDEVSWSLLRVYQELGRSREAAELISATPVLRDALPRAHVALLIDAGRWEEAVRRTEEIAGELTAEDTMAPGFLSGIAWRLRDAGRDREAEALFRRALALDPDSAELRKVLLHLYGDEEERRQVAAAAAEQWRQEEDPQSLLDEGTQRLAAGDAEGAVELLARAAPHFPELEPAWFNLGMAAYRAERWATVDEAFAHAAELNPERAASFFFRGIALVNLERCGDAVAVLERSLELDPARYQAHYYLSGCYLELGDAAAAERHRAAYTAAKPP